MPVRKDSFSGVKARRVTLELDGIKEPKVIVAYRVWEKPDRLGLQLTNTDSPEQNQWKWFMYSRIISYDVQPVNGSEPVTEPF